MWEYHFSEIQYHWNVNLYDILERKKILRKDVASLSATECSYWKTIWHYWTPSIKNSIVIKMQIYGVKQILFYFQGYGQKDKKVSPLRDMKTFSGHINHTKMY